MNIPSDPNVKRDRSLQRQKDILTWIAAIGILVLAAYLRFVNLRESPGWYSDEGIFISLAKNLAEGRWQVYGVFTSPLAIQRPPLFLYTLAALFKLWGSDIQVLRGLTAACGTLNVLLLFVFVRRSLGNRLALLSAGLLAVLPWVVTFNRLGFSYNLMAPFFMLSIFATYEYAQNHHARWAVIASGSAALAFCTDYLGAVAIVVALTVLFLHNRRWLLYGAGIMAVIITAVILPAVLSNPAGSLSDVQFITGTKVAVSFGSQVANLVVNYGDLILKDGWVILALAGLFMISQPRLRGIVLMGVGLSLLLTIRTFSPTGRGLHYLIPLFPFLALGLAALMEGACFKARAVFNEMFNSARERLSWINAKNSRLGAWRGVQKILVTVLLVILLVNPVLWMLFSNVAESVYGVNYLFGDQNELDLDSSSNVDQATAFLADNALDGDLILASQQVLWTLGDLHQTDWGITADYDDGIGVPGQYEYSCSLSQVKFAVVDPLAKGFVKRLDPRMKVIVEEVEGWPVVFQAGDLEIHQNMEIP